MSKSRKTAGESPVLLYGPRAASLLRDIAEATNVDILKPVSGLTLLILETVQIVKANKDECIRLCERVYELICAIINLCRDMTVELPRYFVTNIAQLSDTLQKVLTYVRRQVDSGGLMKRLVRHAEHATLLAECNDGIKHALALFQVQSSILSAAMIADMQKQAEERYEELLEMMSSRSESLVDPDSFNRLRDSASSLSLAPPSPKIFHGRQRELNSIISLLSQNSSNKEAIVESAADRPQQKNLASRIAILGPGGIGKSSLALAVLHHPECIRLFQSHRFFISCESAHNADAVASAIASYFGLRGKGQPSKTIIKHLNGLADASPVLLVLDNFETPWEPLDGRAAVENLLSLLTEVDGLSLILTMRGAERPQNVLWSRPFLPPLSPLSETDARQIFYDICDISDEGGALDELLAKTDYLPLAVTLMASLVSFEGSESVLARWSTDATSLLSEGYDKRSNLEKSILISISSPRMATTPGAKDLLSLAALLPDGLSPSLLERLGSVIPDVNRCRITLCRTSLGYMDRDNRLKVLVPIREFVKTAFPPPLTMVRPLRTALYDILSMFAVWERTPIPGLVNQITSDLGNIYSLISYSMEKDDREELKDTIPCVIQLASYTRLSNLGSFDIIKSQEFMDLVTGLGDKRLEGQFWVALARIRGDRTSPIEEYAEKGAKCFKEAGDIYGEADAYDALAFHLSRVRKFREAIAASNESYKLAEQLGEAGVSMMASSFLETAISHYLLGQGLRGLREAKQGLALARLSGNLFLEAEAQRQCSFILNALGDLRNSAKYCAIGLEILSALGLHNENSNLYRDLWRQMAEVVLHRTEYAAAKKYYDALVNLSVSHGKFGLDQAYSMVNLVHIDVIGGNYSDPTVEKRMNIVRPVFAAYNDDRALGFCDVTDGDILLQSQKYEQAEEILLKAAKNAIGTDIEVLAMCYEKLGEVYFAKSIIWSSFRFYILFFAQTRIAGDKVGTCQALRCIGDALREFGEVETAKSVWELALGGFSEMGIHRGQGDCLLRLGDLEQRAGNLEAARENWSQAKECFERCPLEREIEQCSQRLAVVS